MVLPRSLASRPGGSIVDPSGPPLASSLDQMSKLTPSATYTDAELLALFREAYAKVVVQGQEFEFDGRRWTMADATTISREIDRLEARIAAENHGIVSLPARISP